MLWCVVAAGLFLEPALWRGTSFGPFDLGFRLSGLHQTLYSHVHNNAIGDQVEEFLPWGLFNWRSLHAGRFPLWNPYAGSGMPQFFNFQSAVLSLPELVGYAFPPHLAFLAAVACKLLLAGTGAYVFARVAGLRPAAAVFAATAFELGGPFANEVGWPLAGVMAWMGWIFAFTQLLLARRPGRLRWAALLALCVAFGIYGGFPEADVLLGLAWAAYFAAFAVHRRLVRRPVERGAVLALLAGCAGGVCLAAPLWLPGLQLLTLSARLARGGSPAIPLNALIDWLLQGFYGYPLPPRAYFGPFSYYETAGYLGVPALVLLGVAVLRREAWWVDTRPRRERAHRRGRRAAGPGGRRPPRQAPAAAATHGEAAVHGPPGSQDGSAPPPLHREASFPLVRAAGLLLAVGYNTGLFAVAIALLPALGALLPGRARLPLSFLVAVLAGAGLQEVLGGWRDAATRRAWWLSLGAVATLAGGALAFALATAPSLAPADAAVRMASFWWAGGLLAALALAAVLGRPGSSRPVSRGGVRVLWGVLLVGETLFLASAGAGLNTFGRLYFPVTPAIAQLRRAVGGDLVAFTSNGGQVGRYGGVGLIPEMNVGYGIDEMAVYDPMVPRSLVNGWARLSGTAAGDAGWFVPAVADAATARQVGASFLLAPGTGPAPAGAVFVETVGGERLYRVPGASRFSLPGAGSGSRIVSAQPIDASTWLIAVHLARPARLVARLTSVPGWHAVAGGRTLAVTSSGGLFLDVPLPAGTYTVRLWYWPPLFSVGLGLAAAAVLGWVVALAAASRSRRTAGSAGPDAVRRRGPAVRQP